MIRLCVLAASAGALSGCASYGPGMTGPMAPMAERQLGPDRIAAPLRLANGSEAGRVEVTRVEGGWLLRMDATALPPGTRAMHIHETGRCDAPDFASAGAHWNPAMRQHGRDNPQGAHAGDLPNIAVAPGGRGFAEARITPSSTPFDADGFAVVVHAQADDYRSDPTGNAGGRIACAAFQPG